VVCDAGIVQAISEHNNHLCPTRNAMRQASEMRQRSQFDTLMFRHQEFSVPGCLCSTIVSSRSLPPALIVLTM
jgi:hypothetical protein